MWLLNYLIVRFRSFFRIFSVLLGCFSGLGKTYVGGGGAMACLPVWFFNVLFLCVFFVVGGGCGMPLGVFFGMFCLCW